MRALSFTTEQILERLEILWRKLEDEGFYVDANTVALAIEEINNMKVCPKAISQAHRVAAASKIKGDDEKSVNIRLKILSGNADEHPCVQAEAFYSGDRA